MDGRQYSVSSFVRFKSMNEAPRDAEDAVGYDRNNVIDT